MSVTHDYHLDWQGTADNPVEVCATPGHDEHTRGDALNAERYPHLYTLSTHEVKPLDTADTMAMDAYYGAEQDDPASPYTGFDPSGGDE